jgi:hypothetical protein
MKTASPPLSNNWKNTEHSFSLLRKSPFAITFIPAVWPLRRLRE